MGFSRAEELEQWVTAELGQAAALDGPIRTATGWQRARPVASIYHLCAGNIAVSAETSLLIAIVLGCRAVFKLPSSGLPELEERVKQLPQEWQQRIELISQHDVEKMRGCDAVVIFGSDETVSSVADSCRPQQRVLHYGHKMSLGVVTAAGVSKYWAQAAVEEILAYQQLGCLSPQSYLCESAAAGEAFSEKLIEAFRQVPLAQGKATLQAQALIFDARQRCVAAGDQSTIPQEGATWTVVQRSISRITPGPGFGFIEVVPAPASELSGMLDPWRGKLSSVSFSTDQITPE